MQASASTAASFQSSALGGIVQRAAHVADGAEAEPFAAMVESADLLQGRKTVAINHNGAVYRLQATKLGKLILTK